MPSKQNGFQLGTGLLHSYERAVLLRKLMLVAFGIVLIAILFWAIPWLPYGLSVENYDERVTILMGLVIMASLAAFGTIYHRDLSRRVELTLLTWSTVHEGLSNMRAREYFYERIVIECDRAQAAGSEFAVVALRLEDRSRDDSKDTPIEEALRILVPASRESDCVAVLGPLEIGILAPNTGRDQTAALAKRMANLVALGTDSALPVRSGWAVYPSDAKEAGSLVALAREASQADKAAAINPGPDKVVAA